MSAAHHERIAPPGRWSVDSTRSDVAFSLKHMMLKTLTGCFREFEGHLDVASDGSAHATGSVNSASIDTSEAVRDERLRRSAEFFDAERYPEISFRSRSIERVDGRFRVLGDLTMRGVTNPVELEARVRAAEPGAGAGPRIALVLSGELSRRRFGITWNETLDRGGTLLGDTVKIRLRISAVRINGDQ